MGRAALDLVADYYESLATRSVLETTTSATLRGLLDEPVPQSGEAFGPLFTTIQDVIARYSRHAGHPRFFGYVGSPGLPVAAIGSMIAAALNTNVTAWRSAPAETEIELLVIRWLGEMLGCAPGTSGLLVSGGSMANFAGLAAARSAKLPDVGRDGLHGAPRLRVYVSAETHFCIRKAASMLGIGGANVRIVPTGTDLRMDLNELARLVEEDLAAGYLPFCVVANAGAVGSGTVDPIGAIADYAHANGMWLHVDAAYGGFAALAPSARHHFADIAKADSIALDPHKWLYLPVGCGCVLYKDSSAARAAFTAGAEYTRVMGLQNDEAFAFWDYGPELSRPFRAFDLWLLLKSMGVAALSAAIEENIGCARYCAALIEASDDFDLLAPVDLSIVCFRYHPAGYSGDLDALNEKLLVSVQRDGSSYMSNARIHGKFALRACVINYRTTRRDMEILLDDVRRVARNL
jgi:glutamate/tyrosine decarboxylase-like PLP-dependent enzyme